jgi:hypothetical protein
LYPLYDFTASGINTSWPPEGNQNRVGNVAYGQPNTGLIEVDWPGQTLTFATFDANDTQRFEHSVAFGEMEFGANSVEEPTGAGRTFKQMPAPGKGMARLVFDKKSSGDIALYDLTGRRLRSLSIQNEEAVEIKNLSAGIYLAKFNGEMGKASVKILVE